MEYSDNCSISENVVNNNADYGIVLVHCSNNIVTKNRGSDNFNIDPTISWDFTSIGIYIKGNTDVYNPSSINNVLSDNVLQRNYESIKLEYSHYGEISRNFADESMIYKRCTFITVKKNSIKGDIVNRKEIILDFCTGMSFINNELEWTNFEIRDSNNNSFISNRIEDGAIAFDFEDSSYNRIINNTILRASQCFREQGSCLGNIFENNVCQEGLNFLFREIGSLIGIIAVICVTIPNYLKRRKYMRK
jgi:parallel beta-helix repeat protein